MSQPKPVKPPLLVNLRDLTRQPGQSRQLKLSAPAPADLGTSVLAVPPGSELVLQLLLESVLEGVLVSGTLQAEARGACVRCLDSLTVDLTVELQELFVYPERHQAAQRSGDQQAEEERLLLDHQADLEPMVRDSIVLALPFQPVCQPDCPGLCPECGVRLAEQVGHQHEQVDSRWHSLADWLKRDQEN
ncbi:MAG: YceD family protein [Bifidobacteriaceae bacterium]|nr:YceD family protein [Bifidobacteriaceae bacterium]